MYTSIQTALQNSVWGTTIMVGPGEYYENILMRGGVRIQGAGPTLSFIIWTGQAPAVAAVPLDVSQAVLDGFTIVSNSPNGAIHIDGTHERQIISNNVISNSVGEWHSGGIFIVDGAAPAIINNVFVSNTLTFGEGGGAIYVKDAAPLIIGNTFIGNTAKNGGAIAVFNDETYTATIRNNTFISNSAQSRGGAIYVQSASPSIVGNQIYSNTAQLGAGIGAMGYSSPVILGNQIEYNRTVGTGSVGGGIALVDTANPVADRNIIRCNNAEEGGGVYVQNTSPDLTNNVLTGNYPSEILVSSASPRIANNTLVGTDNAGVSGIRLLGTSRPTIANNIIASEGYGIRGDGIAVPTIRYNDAWMNSVADYSGVTAEANNLNVNPGLRDTANGDYHLQAGSALIDAGATGDAPAFDLEGDARPLDGNGDGIARPDIGADEYSVGPATPTPTASPIPPGTVVTVTLQYGVNGYYGAEDTYIYQYSPDGNYCTQSPMIIGQNQRYAVLVRFDLSSIPADAVVTQALLQIYAEGWGDGTDISIGAHYITRTVDLCQATWNQASSGKPWAEPGANGTATDRRADAESTVTTSGVSKWYDLDLTAVTQGWVNGSLANNGVLLRAAYSSARFYLSAKENGKGRQPKLAITYRTGWQSTATPTPSATATQATPTPTQTSLSVPTTTPSPTSTATPTPTHTPTPSGTLTPTPTATPLVSLPGDIDGDCDVDVVDIMLVAGRWSAVPGDPRYDPHYDLDGDGDIDVVDIMKVAAYWATSCGPP